MSDTQTSRPEHCPEGHEWLPDAYSRVSKFSSQATTHPNLTNAESIFDRIEKLCADKLDSPTDVLFFRAFQGLWSGQFEVANMRLRGLLDLLDLRDGGPTTEEQHPPK